MEKKKIIRLRGKLQCELSGKSPRDKKTRK
jgi:hypothetical protein